MAGLCSVLEGLCVLNVRNHGFTDAFSATADGAGAVTVHRASLLRMLTGLFRRAQDAGALRRDAVVDDLVLLLLAGRGLAALPVDRREAAARRFAALAIDGLRAGNPPLPRSRRTASVSRSGRSAAAVPSARGGRT